MGDSQQITLYNFATSPYGAKVEAYLGYKALEYKLIHINPLKTKEELPFGHTVPVLEIDGEFKNESSEIGIWLDEMLPQNKRLIDPDFKEEILEADRWVSENLIPLIFYSVYPRLNFDLFNNCIRCIGLARQVNKDTKLGLMKYLWPLLINQAPFIKSLIKRFKGLSFQEAKVRVFDEFEQLISSTGFIVRTKSPSLADLSASAQFKLVQKLNLKEFLELENYPKITAWLKQMN